MFMYWFAAHALTQWAQFLILQCIANCIIAASIFIPNAWGRTRSLLYYSLPSHDFLPPSSSLHPAIPTPRHSYLTCTVRVLYQHYNTVLYPRAVRGAQNSSETFKVLYAIKEHMRFNKTKEVYASSSHSLRP